MENKKKKKTANKKDGGETDDMDASSDSGDGDNDDETDGIRPGISLWIAFNGFGKNNTSTQENKMRKLIQLSGFQLHSCRVRKQVSIN